MNTQVTVKDRGLSSGSQEEESEAKKCLETWSALKSCFPTEIVKDFTAQAQCDFYFT